MKDILKELPVENVLHLWDEHRFEELGQKISKRGVITTTIETHLNRKWRLYYEVNLHHLPHEIEQKCLHLILQGKKLITY